MMTGRVGLFTIGGGGGLQLVGPARHAACAQGLWGAAAHRRRGWRKVRVRAACTHVRRIRSFLARLGCGLKQISATGKPGDRRAVKTLRAAGVGITLPVTHGRKGGEWRGASQATGGHGVDGTSTALRGQPVSDVRLGLLLSQEWATAAASLWLQWV
jgi:hypothetical protein